MKRTIVVFGAALAAVLLLVGAGSGGGKVAKDPGKPAAAESVPQSLEQLVRTAWTGLPGTPNACAEAFDYFPFGGMQIFACHLFSIVPYGRLVELAGVPVFLSGPHTPDRLVLDSSTSFGHYNPAFVRWAVDNLVPGATDTAFRDQTRHVYQSTMAERAFLFDATWHKAQANPECWRGEVERYRSLVAAGQLEPYDYERWFYFMNPSFCASPDGGYQAFADNGFDAGYDGNVVKTCVGFWVRRSIDGTAELWHEGLRKLRVAYEGAEPYLEYD